MYRGVFVIGVVDRIAPIGGRTALIAPHRRHATALHLLGNVGAGHVEKGGTVVDVLNQSVRLRARLHDTGPADHEGHLQRFFKHPTFVVPAMFAEIKTLVGGVDEDGIVGQSGFVQVGEQSAYALVDGGDAAEVVLDVSLVFPTQNLVVRKFACLHLFDERLILGLVVRVPRFFLGQGSSFCNSPLPCRSAKCSGKRLLPRNFMS